MSHRDNIILHLVHCEITCLNPFLVSSMIVSRPEICKISQDSDSLIFANHRVPLSYQNVQSVEACVIKLITCITALANGGLFENVQNLVKFIAINHISFHIVTLWLFLSLLIFLQNLAIHILAEQV